jgi:hypothetical protein
VLYIFLVDPLPFSWSKEKGPWRRIGPFLWDYGWDGVEWWNHYCLKSFVAAFLSFQVAKWLTVAQSHLAKKLKHICPRANKTQGMLFPTFEFEWNVRREKFHCQMEAHLSHFIYLHNSEGYVSFQRRVLY